MKIGFVFILFFIAGAICAYTGCYFDSGFGRLMCTGVSYTQNADALSSANATNHSANVSISPGVNASNSSNLTNQTHTIGTNNSIRIIVNSNNSNLTNLTNITGNSNNLTLIVNAPPAAHKTTEQCAPARAQDWSAFCAILQSQGMVIDCLHANEASKNEILDRLVNSVQSYQARCLRGEW